MPHSSYNQTIQEVCGVDANTARYVEAFLRLQYSALDSLSRRQIRYEYVAGAPSNGSISNAIALSSHEELEELARSYGL